VTESIEARIRRRFHLEVAAGVAAAIEFAPIRALRQARYRSQVDGHRAALPTLSGASRGVVDDLQCNGVSQRSLDALGIAGSANMLGQACRLVASEMADFRSQAAAGSKFVMTRAESMLANPEIFLFGLQPLLLDIAEAYIGLPVAYDGATILYTAADGQEVSTRDWHRDREDRRMLKIIVYLNDVDAEGGPFQLLRDVPTEARARRHLYGLTADERQALKAGAAGAVLDCEGPTGTTLFVDTARHFHRGKPAVGRDRAALFFSYFARRPQRPFFCDRSGLARADVERMVRHLSARQRDAALWHQDLPLHWRLLAPVPVR